MASRKEQIDTNVTTRRGRSRSSVESNDQPGASVNMDELRELIALLQDNGLAELELERNNFRVRLRREGSFVSAPYNVESAPPNANRSASATAPATTSSPAHPGAQAETAASEDQDLHIIPSPIVGTFYRSPSPNADPFVKIGSSVAPETVVCIIEAMKLMNEIQSEMTGEVAKIYVENGQPVEYGQPLFGIKS
ncbi:MAG TPA: acetyl-CoA carboxylase biotin carboxyl carrier protein [Pyrinomonadaceae bacterium]|jgi:acetyl-CoA carboxylase, biotin carboxyl carrier protein|nr:acetyl-CoA carboxylase biotin carboxyl carrier protein [Pyrinomonadaceae bacterium]